MDSSTSRDGPERQCSQTSLVLSEMDDGWYGKRKVNCDLYTSSQLLDNKESNQIDVMEEKAGRSTSLLVTKTINGKNCVLPFKIIAECPEKHITTNSNKQLDRYPTEGFDCLDTTFRNQIANYFRPYQQEHVLQRKDLCGDFSFTPASKTIHQSCIEDAKRQKESNTGTSSAVSSAKELKVDRTPFQCPISACGDFVSAAFYSSHLKVEHCGLILEWLHPGQVRTILVNPKLNIQRKNHCNIAYYLIDKLRGFGQSEFQNIVPVLLMSSKFQFVDLELDTDPGQQLKRPAQSSQFHYIFWFTGIVSENLQIQYSLEIGSWLRHHGLVYPLSANQDLQSVYKSGTGLIFSQRWVDQLISRKDKLMEIKLMVQ
ncbi:uncharacterized protein LOC109397272 isoform X2 [Aedes albopictus]|uniref:DUF4729 domain-containing protein n=1 Tax=Aedes albopictus TaxID=7160 RepID=A0ABM1YTT3_AEDAL